MSINKNNYEAFLLDYYEGSLSENEKAELIAFALAHPELGIELEDQLQYLNNKNSQAVIDKNKLKSLAAPTDEEYISFIEGQLTQKEEEEFTELIKSNKTYKSNLEIWEKTILDKPEIIYPKKRSLKHYSITPVVYSMVSAAAIFVLFFTVFNNSQERQYFKNNGIRPNVQITNETEEDVFEFNFNKETNKQFPSLVNPSIIKAKDVIAKVYPEDTTNIKNAPKTSDQTQNDQYIEIVEENQIIDHSNETEEEKSLDSIISPKKDTELNTDNYQNIAQENSANVINTDAKDSYSVKEWVVNKLQEKEILDSTENDPTILEIAANTIGDYESKETDNEKVTVFKIGRFEYYRKKSKHL